jgi:hypothetical protein
MTLCYVLCGKDDKLFSFNHVPSIHFEHHLAGVLHLG